MTSSLDRFLQTWGDADFESLVADYSVAANPLEPEQPRDEIVAEACKVEKDDSPTEPSDAGELLAEALGPLNSSSSGASHSHGTASLNQVSDQGVEASPPGAPQSSHAQAAASAAIPAPPSNIYSQPPWADRRQEEAWDWSSSHDWNASATSSWLATPARAHEAPTDDAAEKSTREQQRESQSQLSKNLHKCSVKAYLNAFVFHLRSGRFRPRGGKHRDHFKQKYGVKK
jgi:hypothetical protein